MNTFDFPVSIVNNLKDTTISKITTFQHILDEMIEMSRSNLSELYRTNLQAYTREKAKLRGFVVGEFDKRNDEGCKKYAQIMCFDVDNLKQNFSELFDEIGRHEYILCAFPSPSRSGMRLFVRTDSDPARHKECYKIALEKVSKDFKIPIGRQNDGAFLDPSCGNISRLWFISSIDWTDVYENKNASVLCCTSTKDEDNLKTLPNNTAPTLSLTRTPTTTISFSEKCKIIEEMVQNRDKTGTRNNKMFLRACLMIEHSFSEDEALSHCTTFSEKDFTKEEITDTVRKAAKKAKQKFTEAQLLKYANPTPVSSEQPVKPTAIYTEPIEPIVEQEAKKTPENTEPIGIEYDETFKVKAKVPVILQVKDYLANRYELRYNSIDNKVEYRFIRRKNFIVQQSNEAFQQLNRNNLVVELLSVGFTDVGTVMDALLNSSFVQRYDPFLQYFESLPRWNGQVDYIQNLANYVEANEQDWFNQQFKKMLVRSIACSIKAIPFNKHCFVLQSDQNDGKTSFLRYLCPPQLIAYQTEHIEIENKDGLIALCENFFINLDELSKMSKKDVNAVKSFITESNVKVRLPYGRETVSMPRRANFVGSINKSEFLTDETGNVRWLIFPIKNILHDMGGEKGYEKNIDIDMVWAQAYTLFKEKFDFQLTRKEIELSEANNKTFMVSTIETEMIQQYFEPGEENEFGCDFLTSTQVSEKLQQKTTLKINPVAVGKALKVLNFKVSQKYNLAKKQPRKGYYIIEVS
jgi:predicted P-loop ATPase